MEEATETCVEEPGWTNEDHQKLYSAMLLNIPKRDGWLDVYTQGIRRMDWEKVAFHPYTAEMCKNKWMEVSKMMRKMRTLTELVNEAKSVMVNPFKAPTNKAKKIYPNFPKKPGPPNSIFYREKRRELEKQYPKLSCSQIFGLSQRRYREMSGRQKVHYIKKFQEAREQYWKEMEELRKQYPDLDPECSICAKNLKRPQSPNGETRKSLHGDENQCQPQPGHSDITADGACMHNTTDCESCSSQFYREGTDTWDQEVSRLRSAARTGDGDLEGDQTMEDVEQQHICDHHCNKKQRQKKKPKVKAPPPPKKVKKVRLPGEPTRPPRGANTLYVTEQMRVPIPHQTSHQRLGTLARRWKTLDAEEKKSYVERVDKMKLEYSLKLKNWFNNLSAEDKAKFWKQNPTKRIKFDDNMNPKEPYRKKMEEMSQDKPRKTQPAKRIKFDDNMNPKEPYRKKEMSQDKPRKTQPAASASVTPAVPPVTNAKRRTEMMPGQPKCTIVNPNVIYYIEQMKKGVPSLSHIPAHKRLVPINRLWQNLTREEKKVYEDMVDKSKLEYFQKLRDWFNNLSAEDKAKFWKQNPTKRIKFDDNMNRKEPYRKKGMSQDKARKTQPAASASVTPAVPPVTNAKRSTKMMPGQPECTTLNPKVIYYIEQMKKGVPSLSHIPAHKRLVPINSLWKNLTREEKKVYEDMVDKSRLEYFQKLQDWFNNLSTKEKVQFWKQNISKRKLFDDRLNNKMQFKVAMEESKGRPRKRRTSDSEDDDIHIDDSSSEEEDDSD